jgi:Tfp pilus assembly protein PilF
MKDINLVLHVVLIKTQACFASFQNPNMTEAKAEAMLQDINNEYKKALEIDQEGTNVDIIGQYSQFLVMSGKFPEAREILTMAMPHARVKEELKLIIQMLEGVLTNLAAAELFRKINMPGAR